MMGYKMPDIARIAEEAHCYPNLGQRRHGTDRLIPPGPAA
jgi:hypothetical protein